MDNLPRKVKKKINSRLSLLEESIDKVTEECKIEFENLKQLFDSGLENGTLSPDHDYIRRLNKIEPFIQNVNKSSNKYIGFCKNNLFKLNLVKNNLYLSRYYGKNIHLSWKFNYGGYINMVEYTYKDEGHVKVIDVRDKEITLDIPANIDHIPLGLNQFNEFLIVQRLLDYGHSDAKRIYELRKTELTSAKDIPPNYRGIEEIIVNKKLLNILDKARNLRPYIKASEKEILLNYIRH